MGFLDELMGEIGSATGGQASAGGDHGAMAQAVLGMIGSPGSGGLEGLLKGFHAAGLGDLVSSWVSTGANKPATAAQIEQGLGGGMLGQLASRTGVTKQAASSILAVVLPLLVNKLTPKGGVPSQADLGSLLGGLLGGGQQGGGQQGGGLGGLLGGLFGGE